MKGKYITLNFEADSFKKNNSTQWTRDQKVFAVLEEDKEGFAEITDIPCFN